MKILIQWFGSHSVLVSPIYSGAFAVVSLAVGSIGRKFAQDAASLLDMTGTTTAESGRRAWRHVATKRL